MSGKTIKWLMRTHKVTIAKLAMRMGFPQWRIRLRRETGLRDPHACRDWIQAITGRDPLAGQVLDERNAYQLDRLYYGR